MIAKNTWPFHCAWLEDLKKEDAQEWVVEQTVLACQMEYADKNTGTPLIQILFQYFR